MMTLLLIAFMATGCSKAVEIPRDQFEPPASEGKGVHRICMVDKSSYEARAFSMTDSTIVIETLNPTDSRYKRVELPIVLPLSEVESISKYELDRGRSFFLLAGSFIVIMFVITLGSDFQMD